PPRRLANCIPVGNLNGSFLFVQEIGQLLPALTFPLGPMFNASELIELLTEHRADALVASPPLIIDLLTHSLRPPSLSIVFYLGAPMGDERMRILTEAAPEIVVRSLAYSASETGPIGYQCPHVDGTTHHVHEDAVIVEVINECTGMLVPNGQTGEV